jgi:hypothetical protein
VQDEARGFPANWVNFLKSAAFTVEKSFMARSGVVISSFFPGPAMDSSAMNESAAEAIDTR